MEIKIPTIALLTYTV